MTWAIQYLALEFYLSLCPVLVHTSVAFLNRIAVHIEVDSALVVRLRVAKSWLSKAQMLRESWGGLGVTGVEWVVSCQGSDMCCAFSLPKMTPYHVHRECTPTLSHYFAP
jgi:hypothetical protein